MRAVRLTASTVLVGLVLAACTSATPAPRPSDRTIFETETLTRTPSVSFTPPVPTSVAPLPPGARPRRGEIEKRCPYIASAEQDGSPSVADIVGSHVYRTTVLTTSDPVGCRFYFYADPYRAIADILVRRFATPAAAYAAMVLTGRAGGQPIGKQDLVRGVDGVLFRTRFYGPDGARDWACVFAAGQVLVVVHTQRDDTSFSALELARAVARKF